MTADIVLQPSLIGEDSLLNQALKLMSMPDDYPVWEPSVQMGIEAVADMDENRITLGIITGGLDRRYGDGIVEKYSRALGGSPSASSLYGYEAWLRCMGVSTAVELLSHGILFSHQRAAIWRFKQIKDLGEKRAAVLGYLDNGLTLPAPTDGKRPRPRKVTEAQKAIMLGVMRPGVVMLDLGALAIDLVAGKKYRAVFYEANED